MRRSPPPPSARARMPRAWPWGGPSCAWPRRWTVPDAAEALAVQIADGTPVDWDAAARGVVDQRILRHLRLVESISKVHRSFSGEEPTPTETHQAPPPNQWGSLELREKLGEGAYGEVYRAFDPRLEREVALKLLKGTSAEALREGRLLAKLRHP